MQQDEEMKEAARDTFYNTNTPSRRELKNGGYRMIFSDKKRDTPYAPTTNHNWLNLRDRSTELSNLFGDANIRTRQ